jgi:hypothetical protein
MRINPYSYFHWHSESTRNSVFARTPENFLRTILMIRGAIIMPFMRYGSNTCVQRGIVSSTETGTQKESRVLPENLIGFQSVKKFPAFYGIWKFITAFISASHLHQY